MLLGMARAADRRMYGPPRSEERLRAHWEIERALADRLRNASREDRTTLYGSVYDELFQRVPDHPQVLRKADPTEREASARSQAALVQRFLPARGVFVEIGAGDCSLSLALASRAGHVYAVEVSREIAFIENAPANFELLITDGRAIPVEPETVDLVYSNQLMEHLHPEDAAEQLGQIFAALRPGGRYMCLTPNRLLGPSDISMYFEDEVANGFHLREYSNSELDDLFRESGFASVDVFSTLGKRVRTLPMPPMRVLESAFGALPRPARRRLKRYRPIRKLLCPGGGVVAGKA
jgi:SAM-dependent methyltransferase